MSVGVLAGHGACVWAQADAVSQLRATTPSTASTLEQRCLTTAYSDCGGCAGPQGWGKDPQILRGEPPGLTHHPSKMRTAGGELRDRSVINGASRRFKLCASDPDCPAEYF
jgi:hypothetical protein